MTSGTSCHCGCHCLTARVLVLAPHARPLVTARVRLAHCTSCCLAERAGHWHAKSKPPYPEDVHGCAWKALPLITVICDTPKYYSNDCPGAAAGSFVAWLPQPFYKDIPWKQQPSVRVVRACSNQKLPPKLAIPALHLRPTSQNCA